LTQEIIEPILSDPRFIEAVYEELRDTKEPPPKDREGTAEDDVMRRIRYLIALRMKKRQAKEET
jgi:hypothetical protein